MYSEFKHKNRKQPLQILTVSRNSNPKTTIGLYSFV